MGYAEEIRGYRAQVVKSRCIVSVGKGFCVHLEHKFPMRSTLPRTIQEKGMPISYLPIPIIHADEAEVTRLLDPEVDGPQFADDEWEPQVPVEQRNADDYRNPAGENPYRTSHDPGQKFARKPLPPRSRKLSQKALQNFQQDDERTNVYVEMSAKVPQNVEQAKAFLAELGWTEPSGKNAKGGPPKGPQ
jgi:hypothetical protein